MKIGLALYPRHLPYRPEPLEELYGSFLDNAVYAEELGYSHVWMGEHHFSPDAWPPSTLVLLTHVAARTSRIRLGTGMLLMPFHHPLRVAEDAIVLDVLSHGRLDLGFSVGSAFHEYRTFNVPMSERLGRTQEGVEVVRRCFTEDRFDHHGKYYDFPDVRMEWYRPVQRPHPPIWIGAFGPKALAWAGRNGYHINLGYTPLYEQVYLPALEAGRRARSPAGDAQPARLLPRRAHSHTGVGRGRGRIPLGHRVLPDHDRCPRHLGCRAAAPGHPPTAG